MGSLGNKSAKLDRDVLALRGWINLEGIIPPSGQVELRASVQRILEKLQDAQATVSKLPKLNDGVPVVPGMAVWFAGSAGPVESYVFSLSRGSGRSECTSFTNCYSTCEAAEKGGGE